MASTLAPSTLAAPGAGAAGGLLRATVRAAWWLLGVAALLLALSTAAIAALPAVGAKLLVITSGSMEPAIATGDAVVVVDTPPADVEAGDVIAFHGYTGDGLTTHRVVSHHEVDGQLHFRTKGDANATADVNLAPADGMTGEVVAALPKAGRPLLALTGPTARTLVLVVPAVVLVLVQARDLCRGRRLRRHRRRRGALAAAWGPAARLLRIVGRRVRRLGTPHLVVALFVGLAACQLALGVVSGVGAVLTDSRAIPNNSFATVDVAPPGNVTATFDCGTLGLGKGILVEWDAVSDVDGYEVARSTTSGGSYSVVANVDASTTDYFDTDVENSTTYYYVVRSVVGDWVSEGSAEASETAPGSTGCLL